MPFPASGYASITSGAALAYGGWTLAWTAPQEFDGLILTSGNQADNTIFNVGWGPPGSSAPTFTALNNWLTSPPSAPGILIPIKVPNGANIFVQSASTVASEAVYVSFSGLPLGTLPDSQRGNQILSGNVSLAGNLIGAMAGSSSLQVTSSPLTVSAKRFWVVNQSTTFLELGFGIGPSTSLVTKLATGLVNYSSSNGVVAQELPGFVPAGQNLFLVNDSGNSGQAALYYLI